MAWSPRDSPNHQRDYTQEVTVRWGPDPGVLTGGGEMLGVCAAGTVWAVSTPGAVCLIKSWFSVTNG